MTPRRVARALWVAAAVVSYAGLSLAAGHGTRRSMSPFRPMPVTGVLVMAFAALVLAPAAWLVPRWPRLAVRLAIGLPDAPSGGRPDEDLGAGGAGDEPR